MGGNVYDTELRPKDSPNEKDFETMLAQRIVRYRVHARRNYLAAYTCYAVAIAASLLGAVAATAGFLPQSAFPVVTAIPGTSLLINSVFSLEKKSAWFYEKLHHYDSLLMRVRFEGFSISSANKELRIFDKEMEPLFPKFGMMPQVVQQKETLKSTEDSIEKS
jgi:hypothetical protein